ncbi:MAG: hypothetical protein ACETWR_13915 [Anaerolineae bacterium]
MLSKLSSHFHAWARGWLILALFAALVVFVAVTLPVVQAATGVTEALDTRNFYTPEEAFSLLASYDDVGRARIRIYYLTGDIVNPILYNSFLILLISWLFQRGFKPGSNMQKLNVIPVGAAIFDLLENICIVTMLSVYPAQPTLVAWLSTVGTTTKYIFIYVSFLLVLVGLVKAAMNRFRKQ